MRHKFTFLLISAMALFLACNKDKGIDPDKTSDQITIDSLIATENVIKAWDTTTIVCYASGLDLTYAWECDHGSFNGAGTHIKYAAGECCVGINTIKCTVSNNTGKVEEEIYIEVKSYFGGGK